MPRGAFSDEGWGRVDCVRARSRGYTQLVGVGEEIRGRRRRSLK